MPAAADNGSVRLRVCAYPTAWRLFVGVLVLISRVSVPVIGIALLTADTSVPLVVLGRALTVWSLLPALGAWGIERAFSTDVEVRPEELMLHGRGLRIEVPYTAVARIAPWRVPVPGPGIALCLQSGRRLSYGLQAADPTELLSQLVERGGLEAARTAARDPGIVYAHARQQVVQRWYQLVVKFVGFALVPTSIWFYAHQHIAYGGLLGQYYLEGFGPYLKTFFISWGLAALYLLLYAGVWRAVAEAIVFCATWWTPTQALRVRRAAEIACGVVYYVGAPLLVILPFLQ